MNPRIKRPSRNPIAAALLLPLVTAALAGVIFAVDTITDLEIAVAVFYVAVVLLSFTFCQRRGVILVSAGCMALTLASYFLTPTGEPDAGLINGVISLSAIGVTTYLALKIESARLAVHEARAQLTHIARVTTLGELSAAIAHEVNQPLAAVVTNGNACLRWLAAKPPNFDEAKQAVSRIIGEANQASEIVSRVRSLAKRTAPQIERLNINEIVAGIVGLTRAEIQRNDVILRTELADDLPLVLGDRVQLQQVMLNLILNAIEAINAAAVGPREVLIRSKKHEANGVLVAVLDSGRGLNTDDPEHLFDAFHTTKPDGMGIGLTITRSIIEAHRGRVWATANAPRGAIIQFTLPTERERLF